MTRKIAPYLFLGQTVSLCADCLAPVPAKIIEEDGAVYYQKRCRTHGVPPPGLCHPHRRGLPL